MHLVNQAYHCSLLCRVLPLGPIFSPRMSEMTIVIAIFGNLNGCVPLNRCSLSFSDILKKFFEAWLLLIEPHILALLEGEKYVETLAGGDVEKAERDGDKPVRRLQIVKEDLTNSIKVLVIDDDEAIALYLGQYFSKKGIYSKCFQSPIEALGFLSKLKKIDDSGVTPFDLVIADFKMPKMDGVSLAKRIKEIYPNMPILLVSAYASIDVAMRAGHSGIIDIIEKPISLTRVDEILATILAGKK